MILKWKYRYVWSNLKYIRKLYQESYSNKTIAITSVPFEPRATSGDYLNRTRDDRSKPSNGTKLITQVA